MVHFRYAQAVTKQAPNGCVPSRAFVSANSQSVYPADRQLADFISALPKKSSSLASRGNTCIGFGVMNASFCMTILAATIGWLMTLSFHALHLAFLAIGGNKRKILARTRAGDTKIRPGEFARSAICFGLWTVLLCPAETCFSRSADDIAITTKFSG